MNEYASDLAAAAAKQKQTDTVPAELSLSDKAACFALLLAPTFTTTVMGLDKNASTAINQLVQEGRENSETFDKLCDKVSDAQQFVKNNSAAIVQTGAGLVEMVAGIGVSGVSAIGGGAAIVLSDGTLYYPAMAATSAGVGAGVAIYDNGAKDFAGGISKMESRGGESSGGGESLSGQSDLSENSSKIQGLGQKTESYVSKRGWSTDSMEEVANDPYRTSEAFNKVTGNKATAYYNKAGDYIVVDDVTGDLVQASKKGDPNWIPDSTIKNPYKPQ